MSSDPLEEIAHIEALARKRWGPTGFRCPHCQHLHAYRLQSRPRVRQCRNCSRQTSVTSGTLMHGTRLSLSCWMRWGQALPRLFTTSELVTALKVARSTAWLLTQKMLLTLKTPPDLQGWVNLTPVRVRRPRPSPPMASSAPPYVQDLHARHLDGRIRPVDVRCAVVTAGLRARVAQVGVPLEETLMWVKRSASGPVEIAEQDLFRWIEARLRRQHRTVSLRWLPRWLGATLATLSLNTSDFCWATVTTSIGPRPLCILDPWL